MTKVGDSSDKNRHSNNSNSSNIINNNSSDNDHPSGKTRAPTNEPPSMCHQVDGRNVSSGEINQNQGQSQSQSQSQSRSRSQSQNQNQNQNQEQNQNSGLNSGGGGGGNSPNRRTSISQRIRTVVQRAFKKEAKFDNLEAIINDNALKLLQQKEIIFKQNTLQLEALCKKTRFSKRELKWLYSGWKVACTDGYGCVPEGCTGETYGSLSLSSAYYGIINENQFQQIYSQFFPYGGDCTFYAKYVFQTMFGDALARNGGFITFTDYALSLSNLLRGSIDDKINFVFRLYDLNNDNVLTIDEISRIFFAIYRLLGDNVDIRHDQATYEAQAVKLFDKIDLDGCGYITQEQFVSYCKNDDTIVKTIKTLEMSIISSS